MELVKKYQEMFWKVHFKCPLCNKYSNHHEWNGANVLQYMHTDIRDCARWLEFTCPKCRGPSIKAHIKKHPEFGWYQ